MPDLNVVIRELIGPLRAEGRRGYRDTTIIGTSLGDYARAWMGRAQQAAGSEVQREQCAAIARLLADYGKRDPKGREQLAVQASRALEALAAGKAAAPVTAPAAPRPAPAKPRAARKPPVDSGANAVPFLDQPLRGVGRGAAAQLERLAKLGLAAQRDLLYYFPREYVPIRRVNDLLDGERAAVVVTALDREQSVLKEGSGYQLMRFALEISDETGRAWVTSMLRVPRRGPRSLAIQGSPPALNYPPGTKLLVEGSVRRAGRFIEIQYGDAQRLGDEETPGPGSLLPVYPLTEGLFQSHVRGPMRRLLAQLPEELPDPLPVAVRERGQLPDLVQALRDIHWPRSEEARETAMRRLALEELLTLQLAMAQRKRELQQPGTGIAMPPKGDVAAMLEQTLPFSLTRAQQRVISEIVAEMTADRPMSRLLQGDVGSGKTMVAAAALLVAWQNGYQGALMAPTELLAEQHYLVLSRVLSAFDVNVVLLTGSLRAKERDRAYADLAGGRAQVVVGTQALIQGAVEFDRLGLVIVDEQHRFGVRQRAELRTKGGQPDMLVMTATPIPRTLALTVYGDLEVSVLDEMPPGRTPVTTRWVASQHEEEAYAFARQQVEEGRQVYVVCALVEESEKLQAQAAVQQAEELRAGALAGLRVGLVHGAMKAAEKDAVMESFRAGGVDVLVATTVIEVGVDVPNASVMLILNAERFGLAQLHQLRGRVGRGAHTSTCLLLTHQRYDPTGRIKMGGDAESVEQTRRRLKVLLDQSDGFVIAEEDLLLRGPGEFYGTRQHGLPDFRLARMVRDVALVEEARETASWLTEGDSGLRRPEHAELRKRVAALRARMDQVAG